MFIIQIVIKSSNIYIMVAVVLAYKINVIQTVKCGHLLVSCGIIFKNASMCIFLEGHGHDFKKNLKITFLF